MKNDWAQVNVLFHRRAGEALLVLYQEFRHSVAGIDRQWEENVFQQQQGKYTTLLKHRLDRIAMELMEGLDHGAGRISWNHEVSGFIQDYLREFGQKIRSL